LFVLSLPLSLICVRCTGRIRGWAGTPVLPPSLQPWEAEAADTSKQIRTPHVHKVIMHVRMMLQTYSISMTQYKIFVKEQIAIASRLVAKLVARPA